MPPEDPVVPSLSALRIELRILCEEQDKAKALAAYIVMSKEDARKYDQRGMRIRELLLMLARRR